MVIGVSDWSQDPGGTHGTQKRGQKVRIWMYSLLTINLSLSLSRLPSFAAARFEKICCTRVWILNKCKVVQSCMQLCLIAKIFKLGKNIRRIWAKASYVVMYELTPRADQSRAGLYAHSALQADSRYLFEWKASFHGLENWNCKYRRPGMHSFEALTMNFVYFVQHTTSPVKKHY